MLKMTKSNKNVIFMSTLGTWQYEIFDKNTKYFAHEVIHMQT